MLFSWKKLSNYFCKKRNYKFRNPKDGYLVYRRNLNPKIRRTLNLVLRGLSWLLDKKWSNDRVNKKILLDLGLDEDTPISSLDAFYKKEFRKKKYIFFVKSKKHKNLVEPKPLYDYPLPGESNFQAKTSSVEFLKTFSQE